MPIGHINQDLRQQQQEGASGNPYQAQQGEALSAQEGKCRTIFLKLHKGIGLPHSRPKKQKLQHPARPLHPSQPADAPANQSPNSPLSPDTKYCAICTPLGKLCPNEFPVSLDWNEDLKEEERKDQDKG